jgi:hypothetical protein
MSYVTGTAAPQLAGEAFVRGQKRFPLSVAEYRGTWVVVALAARRADVLALAELEEAFGVDRAIILATTPGDWQETASRYADESVRFPILTAVAERRPFVLIVDPAGVIRHVGLRRGARETLATLEAHLSPVALSPVSLAAWAA